ncbi:NADH dehydrogenase subunit 2 (mitochondrion) [Cynoglossus semilaevis]|uniref:NADH-ubiquinone oxidoreductase chain 2 n=1 Tax=Cynoglossus semilaevis TaxID=244447 RepID=C5H0F4_CYNSE|nr:NADH dehydrogenase subunit 2 [Cynoglossus semilaevis]ABY59935.1 NADH dehydrogenase subunit 2 [Cynoglossus semilaevis]ACT80231.1 NADH dehydrogenase subunit 2 [Cynoglossus semilaevis]
MNPITLSMFTTALLSGTLITLSSTNWLMAWMGLEINTMAIIPIIARKHHPRATEAATKYFLIQAPAAATILFCAITNAWMTGQWEINQMSTDLPIILILISLAFKMGMAPVHSWLPDVLQGLDLMTGLVLSTWQKLAPFYLILQLHSTHSLTLILLGTMSILVGGWGGLNQTQTRKILAYSSITHMGWMLVILQFSPELTLMTFTLYVTMTLPVFMILHQNNTLSINKLPILATHTPTISALIPLLLLSLGGLPPLTGFIPKWLIIQKMSHLGLFGLATITALSGLFSLYFYLRLSYISSITMSPSSNLTTATWRLTPNSIPLGLKTTIVPSMMLLPLTPMINSLLL